MKSKSNKEPAGQVTVYPLGVRVQVAPGELLKTHVDWPEHLPVPTTGVFEWVPREGGGFDPKIRLQAKWVRLYDVKTGKIDLGGISYDSLRRLIIAKFVKGRQTTPGKIEFDLQSFERHCAAVEADPEFWSGKNLRRYMEAVA